MRLALSGALVAAFTTGCLSIACPASAAPFAALSSAAPQVSIIKAGYFCSPGYEVGYRGACVAVPSRSEVDLYIDQPLGEGYIRHRYRHHRFRHGIRERF